MEFYLECHLLKDRVSSDQDDFHDYFTHSQYYEQKCCLLCFKAPSDRDYCWTEFPPAQGRGGVEGAECHWDGGVTQVTHTLLCPREPTSQVSQMAGAIRFAETRTGGNCLPSRSGPGPESPSSALPPVISSWKYTQWPRV